MGGDCGVRANQRTEKAGFLLSLNTRLKKRQLLQFLDDNGQSNVHPGNTDANGLARDTRN